MSSPKTKTVIRLILSIALCQIAGIVGSIFTTPAIPTWYASLHKPDIFPPNWVFPPVWTTLFLLMGISLFVVWNLGLDKNQAKRSISIFGAQLALNALWSFLFFGLKSPRLGFVDIVALWIMIALTIVTFFRISRMSALLLFPYLVWVSFASYLNYWLMILNP